MTLRRAIPSVLALTGLACSSLSVLSVSLPLKVGNTEDGLQTGLWRYYHDLEGERDGLRASGKYEKDHQVGRWTYHHRRTEAQRAAGEDGHVQWEVGFEKEKITGPTTFYHPNGQVLAKGAFKDALETGTWTFFAADGTKIQEGAYSGGRQTGLWKVWDEKGQPVAEGERDGSKRIGRWRFWLPDGRPYDVDFRQPDEGGMRPSEELLARLDRKPAIPILPQPDRTMREGEVAQAYLDYYGDTSIQRENVTLAEGSVVPSEAKASRTATAPPGYGGGELGERNMFDERKAAELVGRQLPTRFLKDRFGEPVDLSTVGSRGRWLVLVILRGMDDEVCIYCKVQTESLWLNNSEFDQRGAEIAVVFPGDGNRLAAFRASYESEFGTDAELDFYYDEDFVLVEGLGVKSDKAKPTTLLLDPGGVIRWAAVGNWPEARPRAGDILEALDANKTRP